MSFAMLLRYSFDLGEEADRLERAIARVLDQGYRTADIAHDGGTRVSTSGMGDAVLNELDSSIA
jgi:3-isopropylmalate dehydrogenase